MLLSSSSDSDDENERLQRRPRFYRERVNYAWFSDFEFNERFRLKAEILEELLLQIGGRLERNTLRSFSLSPKCQLMTALRWLGTGAQYHTIADTQGISKASVCRSVHAVVHAVNEIVLERVVDWPEDIDKVAEKFSAIRGMPRVIGCADGTLVGIDAPFDNEADFVDRHGNHSINALLVCGPDLQFYYVCANWPGSVHDARVLRTCSLYNRFETGWNPLPNGIILGDSAYPLKAWLIPPVSRNPNDPVEQRFLREHKSTRRLIENSIGILKEKFPCLNHLRVNPTFACEIIKCTVALCNVARESQEEIQEGSIGDEDEDMSEANDSEEREDTQNGDDEEEMADTDDEEEQEPILVNGEQQLRAILQHFAQ